MEAINKLKTITEILQSCTDADVSTAFFALFVIIFILNVLGLVVISMIDKRVLNHGCAHQSDFKYASVFRFI